MDFPDNNCRLLSERYTIFDLDNNRYLTRVAGIYVYVYIYIHIYIISISIYLHIYMNPFCNKFVYSNFISNNISIENDILTTVATPCLFRLSVPRLWLFVGSLRR